MSGLDQELLLKLRQALLSCDEFHSPRLLYAVMGTDVLTPWQNGLPSANSVGERVDLTIHYLSNKRHANGENALVLLLHILAERYAVHDDRRLALLELISKLQNANNHNDVTSTNSLSLGTPEEWKMEQQARNALLDTLCKRISPSELKTLIFKVLGPGAYQNLPGFVHTEKSISFLEEIERQQKEKALLSELTKIRPDIALSPSEFTQSHIQDILQEQTRQPDTETLTWLHLSDLHFRESHNYDETIVLKELLHDIAQQIEDDGLHPDFIAITGDIAFSGKPQEYKLARSFLDDLLETTHLSREQLFIVPGNHDVDRSLVTNGAKAMTSVLTDRDSTNSLLTTLVDRRLVMERFKGYAEFVNNYLGDHNSFDNKQYFYVRSIIWPGPRVMVLGLNSAWVCDSDNDKTPGVLLGERQTRAALELAESGDFKIALLHHPFDWLREFDQNDSAAILLDNCNFILHGHLHRTATTQLSSPDTSAMVIGGGACYETRQYPNMYNFVRLNLGSQTGIVYLRRYSDERGGFWTKDVMTYRNVPDGKYKFQLKI